MPHVELHPDDVTVSIRIPNTLHTKLKILAVMSDSTMGKLLREALEALAKTPLPAK